MSILPIPTTRVSDYLTRSRLVQQNQADQLDLFRLQNQISTGRRIFQPSDDGRSALRSITLQRSLERKSQLQINLNGAQTSLTVAETALNGVGDVLNDIRGRAISVAGTTATDEERATTRTDVLETLDRLVGFANSTYQESYLFAGSQSLSAPFVSNGSYIEYRGNEASQQQNVDTGLLFETNIPGSEVFGGLSEPVRGSVDLSPQVNADTRLSDINGGLGITSGGSLEIGYVEFGTVVESESTVIDLSGARTLGDVARLIEANGPPSANLRASVTSTGLVIETDPEATNPGSIIVREVAGGETADELGILAETATSTVTGDPLDTILRATTPLDDLLGTKASGRLSLPGTDNDLIITANENGTDSLNNLTVRLRAGGTAGSETASFIQGPPRILAIDIDPDVSTAAQVAAAINSTTDFSATIDYRDATTTNNAGTGTVDVADYAGVTSGGSGTSLDLSSGLLISNGGEPFTVDTSGAETVEDLLNLLNEPENGLLAEINAAGTGIDIRTRRSGADFSIGEGDADNDGSGTLATQLGVRTTTTESRLEDFNRGTGVIIAPFEDNEGNVDPTSLANNRFAITVVDDGVAQTFEIDLAGDPSVASDDARTVQDVIDQIATDTGGLVTASLASTGNGLTLTSNAGAVAATPASSGPVTLGGDTLTFTATTPGAAGNQNDFSIEVIDSGPGVRSTSIVGNTIVVDLAGSTPTTGDLETEINTELANVGSDFTVAATSGAVVINAAEGPTTFATTGGDDGSTAGADLITVSGDAAERLGFDVTRTDAIGSVSLAGDALSFAADAEGVATGELGNQSFTIEVINNDPGAGVRTTTVNGNTIVVELGGTTPTTDQIAADISAQLNGFTVTSSGSPAATVTGAVASQAFSTNGGADADSSNSPQGSITSADVNTIEVDSVFNTLLRLADAHPQGAAGGPEIARSLTRLDDDLDRATAARGELGSRLQSLNTLEIRLEDEEVEVRAALSEELDVDLTQAISDFTARQFSLEASLQTTASILQLSLLNFI